MQCYHKEPCWSSACFICYLLRGCDAKANCERHRFSPKEVRALFRLPLASFLRKPSISIFWAMPVPKTWLLTIGKVIQKQYIMWGNTAMNKVSASYRHKCSSQMVENLTCVAPGTQYTCIYYITWNSHCCFRRGANMSKLQALQYFIGQWSVVNVTIDSDTIFSPVDNPQGMPGQALIQPFWLSNWMSRYAVAHIHLTTNHDIRIIS